MLTALVVLTPLWVTGAIDYGDFDILEEFTGSGWEEVDNLAQVLWELEVWQVVINSATFRELTMLPGIDEETARRIIALKRNRPIVDKDDLISSSGIDREIVERIDGLVSFVNRPYEIRFHVRADRRFGAGAEDDIDRYFDSPFGITQRYSFSTGQWSAGLLMDKDKYETRLADLYRFYTAYRSDRISLIAGDFNVSTGYGLTLKTKPVYFTGFDTRAAYRNRFEGVIPAGGTQENSAFRGIGAGLKFSDLQVDLFGASTDHDATLSNDGSLLRLSGGGLHRSAGEAHKRDSVRETAAGGGLRYVRSLNDGDELSLFLSGYYSKFQPGFVPNITARERFQLTGDRAASVGLGGAYSAADYRLGGEVAVDYDADRAWMILYDRSYKGTFRTNLRSILYYVPASYDNPHAGLPVSGSSVRNRAGAAILIDGRCKLGPVNGYKAHIEVERRDWRTFTVPVSFSKTKASLELRASINEDNTLLIRYRRKSGTEGHGEENQQSDFIEDKLRFTLKSGKEISRHIDSYRLWIEGGRVLSDSAASIGAGIALSFRCGGNLCRLPGLNDFLRYSLSSSIFSTVGDLPFYAGEADLPDRLASVRLSGQGLRLAAALKYRSSRMTWLGLQAARTIQTYDYSMSGDIEIYMTLSYNLRMKDEG